MKMILIQQLTYARDQNGQAPIIVRGTVEEGDVPDRFDLALT